jgi:glycosyltransferase involved in cell wall biosynthesis
VDSRRTHTAPPTISIVIPARNEAATIAGAIEPFLADATQPDIEVIVADGRSTDRTRAVVEALAARDPRVRLVDNPSGTTPNGLNAAIVASRGDVIVRMDGHALPAAGYVRACLDTLERSGAWNVGGMMVKTGETPAARAASAGATSPFGIGGGLRYHLVSEPVDLPHVWLGCWPRWVFERVGLFDPEMIRNQDEELNRRILDAGGRIRFDPSISAVYLSRRSWKGIVRQYFTYGIYRVRAVQKHPSMLRVRHLLPPAFVGLVVVSAVAALVVPVAGLLTLALVVAWLIGATWYARSVARRHDSTVPEVIAAYACLHLAYGTGVWVGLIRFAPRWFMDRRGKVPTLAPRPRPH